METAIRIAGLPGWWQEQPVRYDYTRDKVRCPACGGLGMPWHGWFSCRICPAVALVEDGRAWLPRRAQAEDYPDMCYAQGEG